MNSVFRFILVSLLGFCLSLLIAWWVPLIAAEPDPSTLNKQGFEQLYKGKPGAALQVWKDAEAGYRKLGKSEGVTGSKVNQSLAMQALGLYPQACMTLTQTLTLEKNLCQSNGSEPQDLKHLTDSIAAIPSTPATVAGLNSLGDVLRVIGHLKEAHVVLSQALDKGKRSDSASVPQLLLSLANVERSLYLEDRDRYDRTDNPELRLTLQSQLQQRVQKALDLYREVSLLNGDSRSKLFAQINRLGMLVLSKQWLESRNLQVPLKQTVQAELDQSLIQLESASFSEIPTEQSIYAQIKIAESLRLLTQYDRAMKYARSALDLAQELQNPRSLSYAQGETAKLLLDRGQPETALRTFQQATTLAQSIHAWDAVYQWQRAIGRIHSRRGDFKRAEQAYETAIAALDRVRGDILAVNPEVQLSFREQVEPVYREYLRLLLTPPQEPDLKRAVLITQRLQQVELENFLRCGDLDLVGLNQISLPKNTTVFYILNLGDQIGVIVQAQDNSLHYYSADAAEVENNATNLITNLQSDEFVAVEEPVFLPFAQALYQQLIEPAQQQGYSPSEGTLVFATDALLQTIPMALLHDGKNYLVQKYSIATTLGGQLRQPRSLPLGSPSTLIAGLSEEAPSFALPQVPKDLKPLPEVEKEVQDLKKATHSTILLNADFTAANFQAELAKHNFPIVHLTTHGQFSSSREETFLLAWDKVIDVQQIYQLVKRRTEQDASIELLVLSACETAKGDRKSALGIAGLATQAGARSTVASLWRVDASSTAVFMSQFYKHLADGQSKAEALRSAQLGLLAGEDTYHPYYWAPFILVGSWL